MIHSFIAEESNYCDLNPIHFGYQDCKSGHACGPTVRKNWLIHYVASGYGIYKIKNKTYNVSQGEMFVIPPYEEAYYEADAKNPWCYMWIGFDAKDELTKHLKDVIFCPEAEKVFNAMKGCADFSSGRSHFLSARLWDLFAVLAEKENIKHDIYIQKALEYIHSKYMYDITIESLSKELNLERTYFSTFFKKRTGISPKRYLLKYRMNTAASLLMKNISVSVVASSVGYSDLYTFSKMFKKHFGLSPTAYVKQKNN